VSRHGDIVFNHLTLWSNLLLCVWFASPIRELEVALLHNTVVGVFFAMPVGYMVLLQFVDGGFAALDEAQMVKWCAAGAGPLDCYEHAAVVRSFVFHFLPAVLLYVDSVLNKDALSAAQGHWLPAVLMPLVFPAVYDVFWCPEAAVKFYGVPADIFPTFDPLVKVLSAPVCIASVLWMRKRLAPPGSGKAKRG